MGRRRLTDRLLCTNPWITSGRETPHSPTARAPDPVSDTSLPENPPHAPPRPDSPRPRRGHPRRTRGVVGVRGSCRSDHAVREEGAERLVGQRARRPPLPAALLRGGDRQHPGGHPGLLGRGGSHLARAAGGRRREARGGRRRPVPGRRSRQPRTRVRPVPGDNGGSEAAPDVEGGTSSVPIPLLVLGGMSLALLAAGGLGYLSRRRQAAEGQDDENHPLDPLA